ncbi:helix-turn-helix transcriptional regulator [Kitasatospora sp. NPDC093558]|uniref:helix-turn-helix transcriptional regulator n=1 Tax=Kitasatospora sp. NPDC093558 TaxID=3155201 RepID=UPI0034333EC7
MEATQEFLSTAYTPMRIAKSVEDARARISRRAVGELTVDRLSFGYDLAYNADSLGRVCLISLHAGTLTDRTDATSATLRKAIAFIETNAEREITLADIAAAAFVTPRALQYAFRRHLDTTPLAHLRRVRLDAAHRDLLAADPGATTVTEIAMRWGFAHPGHFAGLYRDAYRRTPSDTLRLRV